LAARKSAFPREEEKTMKTAEKAENGELHHRVEAVEAFLSYLLTTKDY
jgi:inosine/xanthosine triphosphate pyrophosphatase family protein